MSDPIHFDEDPELTLVHPASESQTNPEVKLYPLAWLKFLGQWIAGRYEGTFEKVASLTSSEVPGPWRTDYLLGSNTWKTKWVLWKYHLTTLKDNFAPVSLKAVAECSRSGIESEDAAKALLPKHIAPEQKIHGLEDPTQISWGKLLDDNARVALQELVFWKDLEREIFRKEDEEINRRNMANIMAGLETELEDSQN